jgi:hypothetical protein
MSVPKDKMTFYPSKARRSKALESWFAYYNQAFFGNKLKPVTLYWYEFRKVNKHGVTMFDQGTTRSTAILVNKNLKNASCYALQTLLHEMIHMKKPRAMHGPAFHKEKLRLLKAGAYNNIV